MPKSAAQLAFNALLEQYYTAWFRYHPEEAVQSGIPGYEESLRPYADDQIGALISLNEKLLSSFDELDFAALDPEQQIDFSILYNAAALELHQLLDDDWRYRRPQDFLPVNAIHQLLLHPVDNLHTAFKHRMQQIPDYLRGARSYLAQQPQRIPLGWLKGACQQGRAGAAFFRDMQHHPLVLQKFQNPSRLQPLCDQAAAALDDFVRFLEQELLPKASGEFACGTDEFHSLLREKHFLDIEPDALHRFGTRLFDQTLDQLKAVARELRKDGDIEQALAGIREQHPGGDPDVLLEAYRARMKAAQDFVSQHDLVSLPAPQSLKVMLTPEHLRHEIPFAAYEAPGYRDAQQQGYYYVTPVRSEGHLLEHNWTSIDLTCVHEAFPGHHLQFVTANRNPDNSLPRMLNASSTLYEGWALYCEELMLEQGFLATPQHRFMMLRDRLWRALRVMLDVELHCRGLTVADAARRMHKHLGFAIDEAKADLAWYTQHPTIPMGYATGWAIIRALRAELESRPDFNLKDFHNRLLSVGSCALPLVICRAFGQETWLAVKKQVFTD
jgi:uncharacterized protein (DUF885 family)